MMRKPNKPYSLSHRGQAVIQALTAAVITGVIAFNMVSALQSRKKTSQATNIASKIQEVKDIIEQKLRDETSWKYTVADRGGVGQPFYCLNTPGATCEGVGTLAFTRILSENNTLWFDSAGTGSTPNGFDLTGTPCAGYTAAGNDRCPLTISLSWTSSNPSQPSSACTALVSGTYRCLVRIQGTITYSPSSNDKKVPIKASNYSLDFIREGEEKGGYLVWSDEKSLTLPGGTCTPGRFQPRVLNRRLFASEAQGGIVSSTQTDVIGGAGVSFTYYGASLSKGSYQCEVTAPVGRLQTHQARLIVDDDGDATACNTVSSTLVGSSAYYTTPSLIRGDITITANTGYICVVHLCSAQDPVDNTHSFGIPKIAGAGAGNFETYTQVRCRRNTKK